MKVGDIIKVNKKDVVVTQEMVDKAEQNFREMCEARTGPGIAGTDKQFMAGRCNGNQFEKCETVGNQYRAIAERERPGCTKGAYYMRGMSRRCGDPDAWVKSRSDVVRYAKKHNLELDGMVRTTAREAKPKNPVPLAPDLVAALVKARVMKDPSLLTPKRLKKVKEDVINKHTPHWKRKYLRG